MLFRDEIRVNTATYLAVGGTWALAPERLPGVGSLLAIAGPPLQKCDCPLLTSCSLAAKAASPWREGVRAARGREVAFVGVRSGGL